MIWLYRLLFVPMLLLSAPYYGMRMLRRGGYAKDFGHRFGGQKDLPPPAEGKKRIWIQAVSVGEVEALSPLVDMLCNDARIELAITTTTSTGYEILRRKYSGKILFTGIFPLDFFPFSIRAWNKIKPDLCVLMEGEMWPEHLHQAESRSVPIALINARMSDRSFSRYSKAAFIARRMLKKFSIICASGESDLEKLLELGAPKDRTFSFGNLKFDSAPSKILDGEEKLRLRRELGFSEDSLVLLGSSTWPGEEDLLLSAMEKLRSENIDCRLLVVPRHAERRDKIIPLILPFPHCVRSVEKHAKKGTLVYLADTTGELRTLTQIADLAFIGKSIPPNSGGQNPIDCASLGVPMLYGPNMENFRSVCETLERSNAAVRVSDASGAMEGLCALARNATLRKTLSQNAVNWHAGNIGATLRTYGAITDILKFS